jgi:predicted transcriptional regulator
MPLEIARKIKEHPLDFPSALIRLADVSWRQSLTKKVRRVADVAERQQWFRCSTQHVGL